MVVHRHLVVRVDRPREAPQQVVHDAGDLGAGEEQAEALVHATAERMRPLYELIEEKLLTDWDPGMAPGIDEGGPPVADELLAPDRQDESNVVRFRKRQAVVS